MTSVESARYHADDPVKPAAMPYSDAEAGATGHMYQELQSLRRLTKRLTWLLAALALFVVAFFFCFVGTSVHFGHDIHHDHNEEAQAHVVEFSSSAKSPDGYSQVGTLYGGNGYWSQRSTMPQALSDIYVATSQGSVFLAGGTTASMNYSRAVYEYDVLLNEYHSMPELPHGSARGGMAFEPNKQVLYLVAGLTTDGTVINDTIQTTVDSCAYALDLPAFRTWESDSQLNATSWQKRACLTEQRSDFCVVTVDGYLYVFGGYTPDFNYAQTVERYNPGTDKWETMSWKLPGNGRGDIACAVQESGLVYIAGGVYNAAQWDSNPSTWFLNELLEVDVRKGTVRRLPDMPYHRGDLQLTALPNNRLMITGGENTYYGRRTQVGYHEVSLYDIDDGSWEMKPRLYEERFRHAAAYALDAVHVFGGDQACANTTDTSCAPYIRDSHIVLWDVDYPEIFVHAVDNAKIPAVNDTMEDADIAAIAASSPGSSP